MYIIALTPQYETIKVTLLVNQGWAVHWSWTSSKDYQESFQAYFQENHSLLIMINWTTTNLLLSVIGILGLLSTGVVLTYSFSRNKTGDGKYQWFSVVYRLQRGWLIYRLIRSVYI